MSPTRRGTYLDEALVELPGDWQNITEAGMPHTLVRDADDAVGALQFSLVWYAGGKEPRPTDDDLRGLVLAWAKDSGHFLPAGELSGFTAGPIRWQTGPFLAPHDADAGPRGRYWRVWYGSDGRNVVKATYNCAWAERYAAEERQADEIIQSFRFDPAADGIIVTGAWSAPPPPA